MTTGFDRRAATWDDDPIKTARAHAVADAIRRDAPFSRLPDGRRPAMNSTTTIRATSRRARCTARLAVILGALVAGCGAAPGNGALSRDRAPGAVTGKIWQWERTVTPVETVESPAPDRYTLELAPNGRLLVRADCNRGTGSYRIGTGTIALGPIATTRMACPPGSLDARYLGDLQRATAFFVERGNLFIELPVDSGTLHFAPKR